MSESVGWSVPSPSFTGPGTSHYLHLFSHSSLCPWGVRMSCAARTSLLGWPVAPPFHPHLTLLRWLQSQSAGCPLPRPPRCVSARPHMSPALPCGSVSLSACFPQAYLRFPDHALGQVPAAVHGAGEATSSPGPGRKAWPTAERHCLRHPRGETWRQGGGGDPRSLRGAREGSLPPLCSFWWLRSRGSQSGQHRAFSPRACLCPNVPVYVDIGHIGARATLRHLNRYHLQQPCIRISHTGSWGQGLQHGSLEGHSSPSQVPRDPPAAVGRFPAL